ncbi:MAG: F0F1 ATP synthase subunit epsilon [Ktedonobacter sp. 13_1_20CM_3_54_15]|jgi:F-type H+-transporting ATPase subunit epsilon|nr:MAG: F0F1 ATP synthase subunit epsilon [Ktedonobacter sp. 13_2_20CM_53_11]OLB61108.1 MAG: F0F1 ATP synthase subunit epsilon [Ktedonobacter sp. 13_2_20CM_2_54_8]OLE35090.1 MAG: F0F1 ATP synthase subunit epsilon [Ktedonobacter sp. 13_1_20CM_3_54_15]
MATRDTLHVEIVTAERELYSGEANMVSAPGTEGRLGILPRHAALLTTLSPGALNIKLGDAEEPIFISGGFLEVSNNSVIVLADTAELAEEIDQARAQEARRRAQEELAQAQSDVERAELLGALERAMTRLRVAELARRRSGRRLEIPRSDSEQ